MSKNALNNVKLTTREIVASLIMRQDHVLIHALGCTVKFCVYCIPTEHSSTGKEVS